MRDAVLNIGNTWDPALLSAIPRLQDFGKAQAIHIGSLYGNTKYNILGNARSPDRLKEINWEDTKHYVAQAHALGLDVVWTINASCPGNQKEAFQDIVRHAEDVHKFFLELNPDMLVVANPLYLEALKVIGCTKPIELSTIFNITEPNQVLLLLDQGYHIQRVCVPVSQNRNLRFLKSLASLCSKLSIDVEVMVNEFCFLNGANCEGVFRRSCYDMNAHAEIGDQDFNFPRSLCTAQRDIDPVNWLKAKWVLPQHLSLYQELGIHHFKITGRTHPTEFILRVVEHYLARNFEGNLLELWPHLQTINAKNFEQAQKAVIAKTGIDCKGIGRKTFRELLYTCKNDCSICNFCDMLFEQLVSEGHIPDAFTD